MCSYAVDSITKSMVRETLSIKKRTDACPH